MDALAELMEWIHTHTDSVIKAEEGNSKSLRVNINGLCVTLAVPEGYPGNKDEYIMVEAAGRNEEVQNLVSDTIDWIFCHDAAGMTITKLLNHMHQMSLKRFKGVASSPRPSASASTLPAPARRKEEKDDGPDNDDEKTGSEDEWGSGGEDLEYEYEDDDAVGDMRDTSENGVNAVWLREHHMKRRWAAKEAELRAQMALSQSSSFAGGSSNVGSRHHGTHTSTTSSSSTNAASSSMSEAALAVMDRSQGGLHHTDVTNIFSGAASSKVLTTDLLNILRSQEELGLKVEAIDDNIYHWRVQLGVGGFFGMCNDKGVELARDLIAVQDMWGYEYVELEICFTIDLYPFFPPQVKIVRPRFEGFILGQIAQIDSLQLSHWDSVGTMSSVIESIKLLLATHGRVDLMSPRNDTVAYPEGAYTDLEHHLMRLGLLTEIIPRIAVATAANAAATAADNTDDPEPMMLDGESDSHSTGADIPGKRKLDASVGSMGSTQDKAESKVSKVDSLSSSVSLTTGETAPPMATVPSMAGSAVPLQPPPLPSNGGGGNGAGAVAAAGGGSKPAREAVASKKPPRTYWAKGTGYGHQDAPGSSWDVEAWATAQREKDRLVDGLLNRILIILQPPGGFPDVALSFEQIDATSFTRNLMPVAGDSSLPSSPSFSSSTTSSPLRSTERSKVKGKAKIRKGKGKATALSKPSSLISSTPTTKTTTETSFEAMASSPAPAEMDTVRMLEESCLVPFLEEKLANESLLDMERHAALYITCFMIIRALALGGNVQMPTQRSCPAEEDGDEEVLDIQGSRDSGVVVGSKFSTDRGRGRCSSCSTATAHLLGPLPGQRPGRSIVFLLNKLRKAVGVYLKANQRMCQTSNADGKASETASGCAGGRSSIWGSTAGKKGGSAAAAGGKVPKVSATKASSGSGGGGSVRSDGAMAEYAEGGSVAAGTEEQQGNALMQHMAVTVEDCFASLGGDVAVRAALALELDALEEEVEAATRRSELVEEKARVAVAGGGSSDRSNKKEDDDDDDSESMQTDTEGSNKRATRRSARNASQRPVDAETRVSSSSMSFQTPLKSPSTDEEASLLEEERRYTTELGGDIQYGESACLGGFHYQANADELGRIGGVGKQRIRRLAQEHADLAQSLPCTPSSSVWIRTHEERMDCIQVIDC